MRKIVLLAATFLMVAITQTNAQENASAEPSQHKRFTLGLSGVAVDDDGRLFNGLFDAGNGWHIAPYPSRLHLDVALNDRWMLEGAVTFNTYRKGKLLNEVPLEENGSFFTFAVNAKFNFISDYKVFQPYAVGGLGFTYRSVLDQQTPTLNLGLGSNFWIVKNFGLNVQSTARFKLNSGSSNYLLHSLGVIYRF